MKTSQGKAAAWYSKHRAAADGTEGLEVPTRKYLLLVGTKAKSTWRERVSFWPGYVGIGASVLAQVKESSLPFFPLHWQRIEMSWTTWELLNRKHTEGEGGMHVVVVGGCLQREAGSHFKHWHFWMFEDCSLIVAGRFYLPLVQSMLHTRVRIGAYMETHSNIWASPSRALILSNLAVSVDNKEQITRIWSKMWAC